MSLSRGARAVVVAVSATLLSAGCGGTASKPKPSAAPAPPDPFAYDRSQPLAFRDAGRANGPYPIAVRDVSYAVPGGRVEGYLAIPPGAGRLAAVVWLHGTGGTRLDSLEPAVELAGRRSIALTITLPSSLAPRPPAGLTPTQELQRQRRLFVADVIAARRAVDLLASRADVDPRRLGVSGWSLGARLAAVLAGVEPRLRAFALASGGSSPVSDVRRPGSACPAAAGAHRALVDRSPALDRARPPGERSCSRTGGRTRWCPGPPCSRSRGPHRRARR